MSKLFQNKEDKKEFVVGFIVFIIGVLGFVYAYRHNSSNNEITIPQDKYTVSARFNRTDGLFKGDEVRMAGIKIGIVSKLLIDERYGAIATMLIKKEINLPEDTSASIETDGLFGGKHIELEAGGAEEYISKNNDGHITYTQDAMVIEELLDKLISMGKKARSTQENKKTNF